MIRYDVEIRLEPVDDARPAITGHHRTLAHSGDFFMPHHQLDATHRRVVVDGLDVGLLAYTKDELTLLTLSPAAKRYDRQIVERVLQETGIRQAFAASWDAHHVDLFGAFAAEIACQAYQFEFPEDPPRPRDPISGLALRPATETDLPYLERSEFQAENVAMVAAGQLHIAELAGNPVGIGVTVPHPLAPSTVDIGMFANADRRGSGIGRSIIALVARQVSDSGRRPVAGCWWRNWQSRRTLEAAGMLCVGTIFRFSLDADRFT